jgi:hypothetical protein
MEAERAHAFAKAVVTRQANQATTTLEQDEALMVEVAAELGMTEAELLEARAEGQARKQRARAMLSKSAVAEAIVELEQAVAFSPHDVDAAYLLAHALFTRAKRSNDPEDLVRSHQLCLDVLRHAPGHTDAPGLLASLTLAEKAAKNRASSPALMIGVVVAVGTVLSALGGLVWLLLG